jgi:hypothetical protein
MPATVISAGSVGIAGIVRATDPFRAIIGVGIPGSSQMIIADAVVEESHTDRSTITRHPVEGGSTISDNVVDEPYEVTLLYGWSAGSPQNNGTRSAQISIEGENESILEGQGAATPNPHFLQAIYKQFIDLKVSKIPFSIFTGKRAYTSMLIESLSTTTDKDTENCLLIRVSCVQIITVQTTIFSLQVNPVNVTDPTTGVAVAPQGTQNAATTTLPSAAAFQGSLSQTAAQKFQFNPADSNN